MALKKYVLKEIGNMQYKAGPSIFNDNLSLRSRLMGAYAFRIFSSLTSFAFCFKP